MNDIITQANNWAQDLWNTAVSSWEERSQDHNYRDIIARPGIYTALKGLKPKTEATIVDVGCGEGAETFFMRDALVELGWSGQLFGYDTQAALLQKAEVRNTIQSSIAIQFGSSTLEHFISTNNLSHRVDIVTSIFALQEIADIETYIQHFNNMLAPTGVGIFLIVHPQFGEAMRTKGALQVESSLDPTDNSAPWRYAAGYPIVEEKGKTFFVPYFDRTIEDYNNLLGTYFSQINWIGLKPSSQDCRLSEQEHRSPFYDHSGNVYYPEIVEMESSAIIIVKR